MSGQSVRESLSEYLFLRFFNQFKCKSSAYSLSQFWEWEGAMGGGRGAVASRSVVLTINLCGCGHCGYDLSMLLTAANTCHIVEGLLEPRARERERDGDGGEGENVAWAGQICIRRWKLANGKCQLKLQPGLGRRTMINGRDFIFPFRLPLFLFFFAPIVPPFLPYYL